MAGKGRISGIVVEIGGDTTGLSKAISGVNKTIFETQRELRDVNSLLKMDPSNTELITQKQKLLGKEVDATKEKLNALKEAEKQVQKQFANGKVSEQQYNALKREIIETEQKLESAEKEQKEFNDEVKDTKHGKKAVKELDDAVEDVGDSLKEAGKEASTFTDHLKAEVLVEGAKGLLGKLKDVADETREYSKIMGSLKVSSEQAGYSAEETEDAYRKLYGVLGDDQTAATTLANLQAMHMEQSDLSQAIDIAIGAWSRYGDSIPIDGLAEAMNETAKTGTVTGTLADALNWCGISEDAFNEQLAASSDEGERQNMILQALASGGLLDAGEAWQEQNQAMVENNQANAELQDQMSKLGDLIVPLMTDITNVIASVLGWFNSLDSGMQQGILTVIAVIAAIGPLSTVFSSLGGVFHALSSAHIPGVSSALSFLASNPIVAVGAAVVGLVAIVATKGDEIKDILQTVDDFLQGIFAKDWTEVFGPTLGGILNSFFDVVSGVWDSIQTILTGFIDFIQGVFAGDWDQAWCGIGTILDGFSKVITNTMSLAQDVMQAVDDFLQGIFAKDWTEVFGPTLGGILNGFFDKVKEIWDDVKGVFDSITSFISGLFATNWGSSWESISSKFQSIFEKIVGYAKTPINGVIGLINNMIEAVESGINWVIGGANKISFSVPEWVPGIGGNSFGINIPPVSFGRIAMLASGGILSKGAAIVGEAGPELLTMMGNHAMVTPLTRATTENNSYLGGITINVYGAPGQDISELADMVSERIDAAAHRGKAAFA